MELKNNYANCETSGGKRTCSLLITKLDARVCITIGRKMKNKEMIKRRCMWCEEKKVIFIRKDKDKPPMYKCDNCKMTYVCWKDKLGNDNEPPIEVKEELKHFQIFEEQ